MAVFGKRCDQTDSGEARDVYDNTDDETDEPMTGTRSIELEVVVEGTVNEVWQAIATGPGISSWYVPHRFEEQAGAAASVSFGPGVDVEGRVAEFDPPHRIVFDGGEGVEGFSFEWMVEVLDETSCTVRLINSGFGTSDEWDAQFDGMSEGWRMFLSNLQVHLREFSGQAAVANLPTAMWPLDPAPAWARLTHDLGIPAAPKVGDAVTVAAPDAPPLSGVVTDVAATRLTLHLEQPAPGTALVTAEGAGGQSSMSVWSYLYGDKGRAASKGNHEAWQAWLEARVTEAT